MKRFFKILHFLKQFHGTQWIFNRLFNLHCRYANFLVSLSSSNVKRLQNPTCPKLLIVCVAFNRENLVKTQIDALRQQLKEQSFEYVVIDNSTERRDEINKVCKQSEIDYYPVPSFIHRLLLTKIFGNGVSHGAALNWAMRNVVSPRKPDCLALLDHDVFPLSPASLLKSIGSKPFFGVSRVFEHGWYLWPGWSVFRWKLLENTKPDFLPRYIKDCFLDSGGGNYKRFFSRYFPEKDYFANVTTERITHFVNLEEGYDVYHCDCLQLIDAHWLHLINGSNNAYYPEKDKIVNYYINHLDKVAERVIVKSNHSDSRHNH